MAEYKLGDMLSAFPVSELGKMITNIDRFSEDIPQERKDELTAIDEMNKVSEQTIEEDM